MEIPVLSRSYLNGFNYRSLSSLLEEESIKNILLEDICNYLKILLVDPRGWNLRNGVCHGISKINDFNQTVADRIFHIFLCSDQQYPQPVGSINLLFLHRHRLKMKDLLF